MDKSVKAHVLQMMKDFMDKDTSDMLLGGDGKEPKGATIEIVSAKPISKESGDSLEDILGGDPLDGNDKHSYADDIEDLVDCDMDHDSDDKEEFVRKPAKGVKSSRDFFKR